MPASLPRPLLAYKVQDDIPLLRARPVFEHINPLPYSQCQAAIQNRNGQTALGKRRTHMRRHVVRAFSGVVVNAVALGYQAGKELFQIGFHIRVCILLNDQAGRGMLNYQRQQALPDSDFAHPRQNCPGNRIQALATRLDVKLM